MTSVSGSWSQYSSRSLPEMSALLPTDTKVDNPRPRSLACSMTASPSAPDCDENAIRPGIGNVDENVPFMRTPSVAFMIPMQLGPTTRMPWERTMAMSSSWRARPSSPASENPAEMMQTARTPAVPASSTTWATKRAGTHTSTRSGTRGRSDTDGYACTAETYWALGLTG